MNHLKRILLEHQYELREEIGYGASSVAYSIFSIRYNRLFCAKILGNKKTGALRTYSAELKSLCSLDSPYIIRVYDSFVQDMMLFLILEYCEMGTLKNHILKKPLLTRDYVRYSKQILLALSYCHDNKIAHRDVKLDNIFLTQYNTIKLADFGFAKQVEYGYLVCDHVGSVPYAAPELLRQNEDFDPFKADVWAAGISFYVLATGSFPWDMSNMTTLIESIMRRQIVFPPCIHPLFANLIRSMLKFKPEDRPTVEQCLDFPIFKQLASSNSENEMKFGPVQKSVSINDIHRSVSSRILLTSKPQPCAQPRVHRHHGSLSINDYYSFK